MVLNSSWDGLGQSSVEFNALPTLPFTDLLIDQLENAAFCLNADARFLYVNRAFCRLTEFSQQELLLMSLFDINQDTSSQSWIEERRLLREQRSLTKTVRYRTQKNQVIPVEVAMSYLEYQNQELICVFARKIAASPSVVIDATASSPAEPTFEAVPSRRTEAELETMLALLNATLESTAIGIVGVGVEKTAFYFNQTFAEMWQLPDSVPITRDCERARAFFENQVKNPEVFRKAIWEVSSQTEVESYDILELKDGRILAHYAKPQRLNGKIIGRVWSIWDITKFKQAEAALQPSNLLPSEETLEQAKQLAELKARFISVICHQFRSLLNIISFSNSLLRRHVNQWTDDKKQPYLEHIQLAVDQITQLLDEILLFGKSIVGHLQPEPVELDLSAFCRNVIAQTQPLTEDSQQTITFDSPENCWANVDPNLLQLMLVNLLSNAIKYSPKGSTIQFKLTCQENSVVFQIQDQGIGISDVDQQRLFEPFYRASNVGELPGTGLGLATVKNLVELQGGQINLTSQIGVGTTVVLMLPL